MQLQHDSRPNCTNPSGYLCPPHTVGKGFFFFFLTQHTTKLQPPRTRVPNPTRAAGFAVRRMGFPPTPLNPFSTRRACGGGAVCKYVHKICNPTEEMLQCSYSHPGLHWSTRMKHWLRWSLFAGSFYTEMAQLATPPRHCLGYHLLLCSSKLNY